VYPEISVSRRQADSVAIGNPLRTKTRCEKCDRARGSRHIHRHDIRARRALDHGRRVFAFADGTEERLFAVEAPQHLQASILGS
jgi:hypothetical protein